MAKVRVPVANTAGKSVQINSDATAGATIGVNLKLPDGTTPSLTELAAALATEAVAAGQTRSFQQLIDSIAPGQVPVGAVTQHEAAITITASQVSDFAAAVVSAEANDLTAAVVWANIPDANVPESAVKQHEAALAIAESQITDEALLARLAANETIVGDWEHEGLLIIAAGTEGAPSLHFTSDPDTGIYSPAANAFAITVSGTEAVRYTGASAPLIRHGMTTGITASTTQTQGQQPLPGSYNEVSVCANNNDVVTLPGTASGELCIVINNGAKRLQVFPALGQDLGLGVNQPDLVKAGASIFLVSTGPTAWFDVATKFRNLLDTDVAGITANDLLYYDGTNYKKTGGKLTWDATLFDITGDFQVSGKSGFYGTTAIAQQTGVAVTAAGVHAAMVNLGLITA